MSQVPEKLMYTNDHEWVRVEGNRAYVGITDFAQGELGDIVFVEIPEVGAAVTAGETFGTVESVKTVSDLYAPVSGKIVEINATLLDQPELVNSDPYGNGWMAVIDMSSPEQVNELLDAAAYSAHIAE